MQIAKCEVRLSGDVLNTVQKTGVTPAEVIVLRAIHGFDAVVNIQATGSDRREHIGEYHRLVDAYKSARDEEESLIVPKIFPGAAMGAPLPEDFKAIGINIYEAETIPGRQEGESEEVLLAREIYLQAVKDDDERKKEEARKRRENNQELADTLAGSKGEDKKTQNWQPPVPSAS